MPRLFFFCGLSLLLSSALSAATVLERRVEIEIRGEVLIESSRLVVRIDDERDAATWSSYRVDLDQNRRLLRLEGSFRTSDGREVLAGETDREVIEQARGVFHASRRVHLLHLRGLEMESVVTLEESIEHRPYYPASKVLLAGGEPIERLEVSISGSPELRWHLSGPRDGLELEETQSGLAIRGLGLAGHDIPELAPETEALRPVLRFAWDGLGDDPAAGWAAVARWYHGIVSSLPRGDSGVAQLAAELTAGLESPEAKLETLARFVQSEVRYVAVLIGEGGYRPAAPAEVLERRWGDCKDKVLLLVDLLTAVGVEAHPALLRNGRERRLDAGFPSPESFNHALVAVPTAGGYLFVDPTQERGGAAWLHPKAQGHLALVVHPDRPELVMTPLVPEGERRSLEAELEIGDTGDARGRLRLALAGELADRLLHTLAAEPGLASSEARALLADLVAGAELEAVKLEKATGPAPEVEISAALAWPALVQGEPGRRSFTLPGLGVFPPARWLRGRSTAVAPPTGLAEARWRLVLPESWCPPAIPGKEVENALGRFHQSFRVEDGRAVVERRGELRRRWIEPGELDALRELSSAESRTHRRRLRLTCP